MNARELKNYCRLNSPATPLFFFLLPAVQVGSSLATLVPPGSSYIHAYKVVGFRNRSNERNYRAHEIVRYHGLCKPATSAWAYRAQVAFRSFCVSK